MKQQTTEAAADIAIAIAMKALAHPRRVKIYRTLRATPSGLPYGELLGRTGLTIATLNHHLKFLRAAEAVTTERRGVNVIYRLAPLALTKHLSLLNEDARMSLPPFKPVRSQHLA